MKTKNRLKLWVVVALGAGALSSARAADTKDAKATWDHHCAACHGKDGKAETPMGRKLAMKDLTDPKVQASFTDAEAVKSIKEGVTVDGRKRMKGFSSELSDDEVNALVKYVREFEPSK